MALIAKELLSVRELNRRIRILLEEDVGEVHVVGEISNCARPGSGHLYFTLKDNAAQIRAVYFKNRHTALAGKLKDGMQIEIRGRLSLYEPRGDYQLIVHAVSEAGLGDLFLQYEALKQKLQAMGLFEASRKKKIPSFPVAIGVITSPTGAALHDIQTTLYRRYPQALVKVYPSEVQGREAASSLTEAILKANAEAAVDVIILARGGGSLEDLFAFNDERLALTIAQSQIPIISGVGHETDFTIADFVADLRAATPTAAAMLATPDRNELLAYVDSLMSRLHQEAFKRYQTEYAKLRHLALRLESPARLIATHSQTLDYLERRLLQALLMQYQAGLHRYRQLAQKLSSNPPSVRLGVLTLKLTNALLALKRQQSQLLRPHQERLANASQSLHLVSPLATLARGYAIAMQEKHVIAHVADVVPDKPMEVTLVDGRVICQVKDLIKEARRA